MASSDDSKSIISSSSIPFAKSSDAFQDMTAFSPPADSWIIRYPTKETKKEEPKKRIPVAAHLEDPCRKYIDGSDIAVKSNKSLGTDDHFKSAVCSKNLLKVCEKLMTNKEFVTHTNDTADDDFEELSLMNEKSRMDFYRKKHGNRRGSRSLPASPKMERKGLPELPESAAAIVNSQSPYFTVAKPEQRAQGGISFLTSLFGITAVKPAEARANLEAKYEHDKTAEFVDSIAESAAQRARKTPRPQENREINMFSPTSM